MKNFIIERRRRKKPIVQRMLQQQRIPRIPEIDEDEEARQLEYTPKVVTRVQEKQTSRPYSPTPSRSRRKKKA